MKNEKLYIFQNNSRKQFISFCIICNNIITDTVKTKRENFYSPAILFLSGTGVCFPEFAKNFKKVALSPHFDSDFMFLIINLTCICNSTKPDVSLLA